MLSEVSARRVSVGLSLFAAVCAGYLAGSRAILLRAAPAAPSAAVSDLPSALENAPAPQPHHRVPELVGAGVSASSRSLSEKDRVDALYDMFDLKVWRLSVTPVANDQPIECEWVLREAGKPDLRLVKCTLGTNIENMGVHAGRTPVTASLMPVGGRLTEARHLKLHTQGVVYSHTGVVANPFLGVNSWGREISGDSRAVSPNVHGETEIPLFRASKIGPNFTEERTIRLLLVLSTGKRQ